jgi:hypothetical protein
MTLLSLLSRAWVNISKTQVIDKDLMRLIENICIFMLNWWRIDDTGTINSITSNGSEYESIEVEYSSKVSSTTRKVLRATRGIVLLYC